MDFTFEDLREMCGDNIAKSVAEKVAGLEDRLQSLCDENETLRDQIDSLEEELEAKEIEILDLHREFIEEGI